MVNFRNSSCESLKIGEKFRGKEIRWRKEWRFPLLIFNCLIIQCVKMVLRVISKALDSNPRNIKAICLYVCASMRDGFICLSIFYCLPVYLSPRHLSSTIYQSVLVLYHLSGSSVSRCHRLLQASQPGQLGRECRAGTLPLSDTSSS